MHTEKCMCVCVCVFTLKDKVLELCLTKGGLAVCSEFPLEEGSCGLV